MSTTPVLRLDAYRGRRQQRVERTLTLLSPDPVRGRLAELLVHALEVTGGDRAAVFWLDDFAPRGACPHVVIDQYGESPRRWFDPALFQAAWERGIPGTVEVTNVRATPIVGEAVRSAVCLCLGSDGVRTWFLGLDSTAPRPPLEGDARAELMHLAGRCTTLILHRDLLEDPEGPGRAETFTGWSILSDIDTEGASEARITERFLVMRLVRAVLDEDLSPADDLMHERVGDLRAELADGVERPYWDAVLDAVIADDASALVHSVLEVGLRSQDVGELEGALEAFRSGYWLAATAGDAEHGLDAARYLGRSLRRAGRWDDSERWYSQAVALARVLEDHAGEALALDGQAATLRARGNLPGARRVLDEALGAAERAGDAHALGSVHQQIMTAQHLAGRGEDAIRHGWASVRAYRTERDQLRALVSLAGILLDLGAVEVAEEAYEVALQRVEEGYYRAFALEGYAHSAALLGDRDVYERRYRRVTNEAAAVGGVDFQAQARLYRGRAYQALGDMDEARRWFVEAMDFAEAQGLNTYVFQAEQGLKALENGRVEPVRDPDVPAPWNRTLDLVRGGLGDLRRELTGVGA
jgi:tetratricopeptide (TPR) repeat protein